MGGAACAIPHFAIMADEDIPTHAGKLLAFDQKLRRCFEQSDIVAGIVEAGQEDAVCEILKRSQWTLADRTALKDMLDALYDE